MKVAIIGSGAAATGALAALSEWCPQADVTVFDIGEVPTGPLETRQAPGTWSEDYYRRLYAHVREQHGLTFPPPKTHFGKSLSRLAVDGKARVTESRWRGGLTNMWGALSLPYSDRDLGAWPVNAADLAPYYRRIARLTGVSGRRDGINDYFEEDFVNRPPIEMPPIFHALEGVIAAGRTDPRYRLFSGVGRLAVETRDNHQNHCVYCGECMNGCSANAIYSARQSVDSYEADGLIKSWVTGKALSIDPGKRSILVRGDGQDEFIGTFDKIYVCAGCVGSTEIVMRSLGLREGPVMIDNSVYTFPILSLKGHSPAAGDDRYFSLTNLLIGCVAAADQHLIATIQVYPSFDHLWRYFTPVGLWDRAAGLGRFLRRHALIARLYLHSEHSQRYGFRLDETGRLKLHLHKKSVPLRQVEGLWAFIRESVNRQGFHIPNLPPIKHASSTHYAGALPYGGDIVPVSNVGEVMPGVYLCDSAVFPDSPALPPTFTIMANACRIVHSSLDG